MKLRWRWSAKSWILTTLAFLALYAFHRLAGGMMGASRDQGVLIVSVGLSALFWAGCAIGVRALPTRLSVLASWCCALIAGAAFTVADVAQRGLGLYPKAWMIAFVGRNSTNWMDYVSGYVHGGNLWLLIVCTAGFLLVWRRGPRPPATAASHRAIALLIAILALGSAIGGSISLERRFPGARLLGDVSLIAATFGSSDIDSARREVLPPERRWPVETPATLGVQTSYDIVMILIESWSRDHLNGPAGAFARMPNFARYLKERGDDVFLFDRMLAAGTLTNVSLPALFTGLQPHRSEPEVYSVPLLWDWLKAAGMRTAFITSQKLTGFSDLPSVFRTPSLDRYEDQGTLGGSIVNDLGMDDLAAIEPFVQLIHDLPANQRFAGVFFTNSLHYPYQASSPLAPDLPKRVSAFDSASLITDRVIERVLTTLRDTARLDRTFLVFVGDHGEVGESRSREVARGENPWIEIAHIPLVIVPPKGWSSRNPKRVSAMRANRTINVSTMDLLPTMIDAVDLWEPERHAGQRLVDGTSLMSEINAERVIVTSNFNAMDAFPIPAMSAFRGDTHVVGHSRLGTRMYNWRTDPTESRDLWGGLDRAGRDAVRNWIRKDASLARAWPVAIED